MQYYNYSSFLLSICAYDVLLDFKHVISTQPSEKEHYVILIVKKLPQGNAKIVFVYWVYWGYNMLFDFLIMI